MELLLCRRGDSFERKGMENLLPAENFLYVDMGDDYTVVYIF